MNNVRGPPASPLQGRSSPFVLDLDGRNPERATPPCGTPPEGPLPLGHLTHVVVRRGVAVLVGAEDNRRIQELVGGIPLVRHLWG